jgi:hypothetical protein
MNLKRKRLGALVCEIFVIFFPPCDCVSDNVSLSPMTCGRFLLLLYTIIYFG